MNPPGPSDEAILRFSLTVRDEATLHVPLVSTTPIPLQALKAQYQGNNPTFGVKIDNLGSDYVLYMTRGDGECFYRAFGFALFTQVRTSPAMIELLVQGFKSTSKLLDRAGISTVVYEDFLETTCDVLQSQEPLTDSMNDPEKSNSVVVFFRLVTSAYLKTNADEYQPFLREDQIVKTWAERWVEPIGTEADNIQINALVNAVKVGIDIVNLDSTEGNTANIHKVRPDVGTPKHIIRLLYRPGHYDVMILAAPQ